MFGVERERVGRPLLQQLVERMGQAGEVIDEPPINVSQAKELSQLCFVFRGFGLSEGFNVCLVYLQPSWLHHVA